MTQHLHFSGFKPANAETAKAIADRRVNTSNDCTQVRRMLITTSTLNIATGQTTPGASEWVTRPCGTPLFGARSRALGKCPACESGWTHPNNYAVEVEATS